MIFAEIILHNFAQPLAARAKARKFCGPYRWTPSAPGKGRGFYCGQSELETAEHGAGFRLRLEYANDHLRNTRMARTTGYYCDSEGDTTLTPIVARLPHGRGFLAGWTMGANMLANVGGEVYADAESAAYAAHSSAEHDAELNREAEARDLAESEAE